MYQNIDFSKTGGFPLTQNTMDFIQNSYNEVLAAASHSLGEHIILTGVVETPAASNNYTDGWITYEGEIIPFVGGVGTGNIVVTETSETLEYSNGDVNNVVKTRKAGFAASGGVLFSAYKRLSLETLKTDVTDAKATADAALAASGSGIPAGVIVMWSGSIVSIPAGWGLCDGIGGRPDLSGRFIVGYQAADPDYNTIGNFGGSKRHQLIVEELPQHSHSVSSDGAHTHSIFGQSGGDNSDHSNTTRFAGGDKGIGESGFHFTNSSACQSAGSHIHTLGITGDNYEHENRPPYYTLAYIIKI